MDKFIITTVNFLKNIVWESNEDEGSIEHVDMSYDDFFDFFEVSLKEAYKLGLKDASEIKPRT